MSIARYIPRVRFDCPPLLCSRPLNTKTDLRARYIDSVDWQVSDTAFAHARPLPLVVSAEWKFLFCCHQHASPLPNKKEKKTSRKTSMELIAFPRTLICFEIGEIPYKFTNEPAASAQNVKRFEVFGEQFSLIFFGPNECWQLWMWNCNEPNVWKFQMIQTYLRDEVLQRCPLRTLTLTPVCGAWYSMQWPRRPPAALSY